MNDAFDVVGEGSGGFTGWSQEWSLGQPHVSKSGREAGRRSKGIHPCMNAMPPPGATMPSLTRCLKRNTESRAKLLDSDLSPHVLLGSVAQTIGRTQGAACANLE